MVNKDEYIYKISTSYFVIFSERELMFRFAIWYRRSVCRLSVCDVGAPNTQPVEIFGNFYSAWYLDHPLTCIENFTEIVTGEPLHRGI